MIWAVADTNVLISALIFGGLPELILDLAKTGVISLSTSPVLLLELEHVLQQKFDWQSEEIQQARVQFESFLFIVNPTQTLKVIVDDPADDRVLECALESHAEFIITGDRHLLKLSVYEEISIITPRRFVEFSSKK